MKLTDNQKIKFRKAIERVLKEERLKSILVEHEEKFGSNFYNQISGSDYQTRIINLLRELDNQGKFRYFLDIVSQEYPIIKERYQIYTKLSPLIFLVKKIFKEDEKCLNFLGNFDNVNDLENYLLELTDKHNNSTFLSVMDSSADLLLLDSYPGFIDFVETDLAKILTSKNIRDNLKQKLRQWIKINCPDADITHDEQQISSNLQSYLLITIFPIGFKTKNNRRPLLNVQAELIEHWGKTQNTKVELEKEDIKEDGYSEPEIPNIIYKFIEKAQEYLNLKMLPSQTYDLKVELFLTIEFFTKDFEFKIFHRPEEEKKAICEKKVICEEYSVILRSLERLNPKKNWLNSCMKKWNKIKKEAIEAENILAFEDEYKLNELLHSQKIKQLGIKLEEKMILKISCGLPTQSKSKKLFEIIVEKGVPLCLWIKSKNKREKLDSSHYKSFIDQLNNLIEVEDLQDIDRLYTKIFEIRKKHFADPYKKRCLGYHLRILCDYTERRPINLPAFNQLTTNY